MHRIFFSLLLMLCFLAASCSKDKKQLPNKFTSIMKTRDVLKPLLMVHRGRLGDSMPENAISSFDKVYELSDALLIEFDVRMTKDSVHVLLHDSTLDRTTTGEGVLSEKKYESIKELNLITNIGDTTTSHIPKYSEAIRWSKNKNFVCIDAKPGCDLKEIVAQITESGILDSSMVICYSIADAMRYYDLSPDIILAIGFNSWDDLNKIKKSKIPFQNLVALTPHSLQDERFYKEIRKLQIPMIYGTFGTLDLKELDLVKDIYRQHALRFNVLTTDRAGEVFTLLSKKQN
ncbi:glycerophosphodiester phosphodiesterase family protein [Aquimarina sediminis]|uniref:glycerophosphodiester phosphodiesterase family protein n=1 Tax=Aquimarina sediminis TaxID=2070536 RepID=UPI000CA049B6|nr:glycerophosphodiester phosphodiesterase family protein [Aquimarina sediminis]